MKTLNYYESNAKSLAVRYESANVDTIHKLLLKTFIPDQHLLEIGYGSGRDASFMHRNGYDIKSTFSFLTANNYMYFKKVIRIIIFLN